MNLLSDLKFTLRLFFKNLRASVLGVFVLSIGIAMAVCMFMLANGILWTKPDITVESDMVRLAWLSDKKHSDAGWPINVNDYHEIRKHSNSFTHLATYQERWGNLLPPGAETAKIYHTIAIVSDNFFQFVGEQPYLGRMFDPEVESTHKKIAISYDIWQNDFGSDDEIIGKSVYLWGQLHEIFAVMPSGFSFPRQQQIWVPSDLTWQMKKERSRLTGAHVIGSLKEGVSKQQALQELKNISLKLKEKAPQANDFFSHVTIKSYSERFVPKWLEIILYMLIYFSAVVLIIACANVSNLIMAMVVKRQHELSIRRSLGASKKAIVFTVVSDAMLISLIAGVIAVLIVAWGSRSIWHAFEMSLPHMPYWWHMDIDINVVVFALSLSLLAALVSSLAPAIRVIYGNTNDLLKDSTRTASGLVVGKISKSLLYLQVMLATVLLSLALAYFIDTLKLTSRDLTFDPDKIMVSEVNAQSNVGYASADSVVNFYQHVGEQVSALPGVEKVAFSFSLPSVRPNLKRFAKHGENPKYNQKQRFASFPIVTNDFFEFLDLDVLDGRVFTGTDVASSQYVAVVNQYFAEQHFPNDNPIGKEIRLLGNPAQASQYVERPEPKANEGWVTIVGVVSNYQGTELNSTYGANAVSEVYLPLSQYTVRGMYTLVKGKGDIKQYTEDISEIIKTMDKRLGSKVFKSIDGYLDNMYQLSRLIRNFVVLFGTLSLMMAAIGLYALTSFSIEQKNRELGIRMALGASTGKLWQLLLSQYKQPIIFGVIFGAVSAYFLNKLIATISNAKGTEGLDYSALWVYPAGIAIVSITIFLAILFPVLKVAKQPPNHVLRVG